MKRGPTTGAVGARVYISLAELARLIGWTKMRTFRWARREKVIFMLAGRWVTTQDRITQAFPDVRDKIERERQQ